MSITAFGLAFLLSNQAWGTEITRPTDFAIESGPGLTTAAIVDLYVDEEHLWALGLDGTAALWDGKKWSKASSFPGAAKRIDDKRFVVHDLEAMPDGNWLGTNEGLVWVDEEGAEKVWMPPNRTVFSIARSVQDLFLATGPDGVWQLSGQRRHQYSLADGLPSPVANVVIEAHNHKIWVGTDRGVALLNPNGFASPLPLAPMAANIPVVDVLPHQSAKAVASDDGIVWLGKHPPNGWTSLVAAVGPYPLRILRSDADWWVLGETDLFQLDGRGNVHRWLVAGTPIDATLQGDKVVVAVAEGLFWWVPGAKVLSPISRIDGGVRSIASDPALGLWVASEDRVLLSKRDESWAVREPLAIATSNKGVWVASAEGLLRLDSEGGKTNISQKWGADPLVALCTDDEGGLWAADASGRIWGPNPEDPNVLALNTDIFRLYADGSGIWAATAEGLFHIAIK
ncbi:MAG: hypothetical protein HN348_19515 [Proteobacteria bacterium]|nr:hypothetical protein [Pseudomonadota bacterium]